ncbi:MAG TPA: hypothetical protein VGD00_11205, partial [Solirubrobacteraceae bacterium]
MAQLSRPYQIGLVAVALLAAAWLLLIQGHASNSSSPGSSGQVSSPSSPGASSGASSSSHAAATSHAGTSSGPNAPGVAGLSRAVQKAHGAAAATERKDQQIQRATEAP